MSTFFNDIKYAIRMLAKRPGFTFIAVLILALGIGANTTLFSIMYHVLLSPIPFPDGDRIVMVEPQWDDGGLNGSSSAPDYLDWQERNTVFKELGAFTIGKMNLTKSGDPLALKGFYVSTNFFDVFNPNMTLGRGFLKEEEISGQHHVAVLCRNLWREKFNSDPDIINKEIYIDNIPHTVVGIAGYMTGVIEEMSQIYIPIPKEEYQRRPRDNHFLMVMGRLKDGVTLTQAQQNMFQVADQLKQEYPKSNSKKGVSVCLLQERFISEIRPAFYILYGAVTLLLIVACVNISNLLLAKSSARNREFAVRHALGSSRFRMIRQLMTESLLLGLTGGILGLFLGYCGLILLKLANPQITETGTSIPGFSEIQINTTVLVFTFAIALVTSVVVGLIPAIHSSRFNLNSVLKETAGAVSGGSKRHNTLGVLVVSQVALSCILLVGAGLLVKSFIILKDSNPGFNQEGVLAIHVCRSDSGESSNQIKHSDFFNSAVEKLAALPGVELAGGISLRPLVSENNNGGIRVVGKDKSINTETRGITSDYFQCLGIPLHTGRQFSLQDTAGSTPVVIVNQEFVRKQLPDENPIGQSIRLWGKDRTIVGVVGDVKMRTLKSSGYKPFVYYPHTQVQQSEMTLFIRTTGDPMELTNSARQAIWDIDPYQPILYITKMNQLVMQTISMERFCMRIIIVMAAVALFMALAGLYAVMAFSVNERLNEVGIRMTLGAGKKDILLLVVKKAFVLTLIGLAIGISGALFASKFMGSMLYEISCWDPITFTVVPILLFAVSMLACYLPARKAILLDPMNVLRCE